MFEKGKPIPGAFSANGDDSNLLVGSVDSPPSRGPGGVRKGEALRAIEWSELTARLNAARDLRKEMREDAVLLAGSSGASFGDAAERFFKTMGSGERPVNHDGLEGRKASCGNPENVTGNAMRGDARE